MKLHRTSGQPDWAGIDKSKYNFWQLLAAKTSGVITPGNIVTIVGLVLVIAGFIALVRQDYWLALTLVMVGRGLDLVDGWLAELTQTKSPLGEIMDATVDKLETIGVIIVLAVTEIAPRWVLAALAVPHVMIAIISILVRIQGKGLHPSRVGKVSMALLWLAVGGFIVLSIFNVATVGAAAYVAMWLAVSLGLYALAGYAREALVK